MQDSSSDEDGKGTLIATEAWLLNASRNRHLPR
jgi:hypothetical protein